MERNEGNDGNAGNQGGNAVNGGNQIGNAGNQGGNAGIRVGMWEINWNRKNKMKVYNIQFSFLAEIEKKQN